MTKKVRVSPSQVAAARLLVNRSVRTGQPVAPGIEAIAKAKRANGSANAVAGRYVSRLPTDEPPPTSTA